MEKSLNNRDIRKFGDFNDNQIFFIQRWTEILNTNTHGRYSVKYLNSHQALKEVVSVCEGIINGEIKPNDYHIKLVIEEARTVIENDQLFKKKSDPYHKIALNCLQGNGPKSTQVSKLYSIIYQLKYIIEHLKTNYLEWIIDRLRTLLLSSENTVRKKIEIFGEIDSLILALVSELIGKGWSITRLYELVKKDLLKQQSDNNKWEKFFQEIMRNPQNYICIFRIESSPNNKLQEKMIQFELDLLSGEEILGEYSDCLLRSHISVKNKFYIRQIVKACDHHSAINFAWFRIVEKLDVLRFYGYSIPEISKSPIVIGPDENIITRNVFVSLLLNKKKFKAPDTILEKIRAQLSKMEQYQINQKIKSLFEFNRISEESLSPQSTFLNLWIALESFVQKKEKDGGIDNVKMVVGATTSQNYIYSLVKNFIEDCQRCNLVINQGENNLLIGQMKVQDAISILLNDNYHSIILENCDGLNNLLGYRYRELRDILIDGKHTSKVIEDHRENIKRHLQRLYRVRNAIVHSSETHYNINLFINHLSDYIESTMSEVLKRLEGENFNSLDEVFAKIRDNVDSTIEVLGSSKELDKNEYYRILLNGII